MKIIPDLCKFMTVAAFFALVISLPLRSAISEEISIHSHINSLIAKYAKGKKPFANKEIGKLFKKQGFRWYLKAYPVTELSGGYDWKLGMGREFIGPLSNLPIKAPFSDYLAMNEGPVLNPKKTYRIGFAYHGAFHPWLISLADTAVYEANLHPNVKIEVYDAEFDDKKMGKRIDDWISRKFDAIVLWPVREAPMGPPVDRAVDAGIPVVSLDRRTSSQNISSEVLGNFYANGLQQGLFLNHIAKGKGKMILNRKALGSTADSMRTGAFLEVIGDSQYQILESFHTNSQRALAVESTRKALAKHSDIEVVFNTGGEEALGALDAVREAKRLNSAPGGRKIIFLANDDSKATVEEVRQGNIDVVVPYTPMLGGLGVRVALMHIGFNAGLIKTKPKKQIITPNLPMITREKLLIDGIQTVTPDQWPYAYGPEAGK
jgi:ABC-type sugar transport system substrate-binding protein